MVLIMAQSLHHDGVIAQSACGYAPPPLMYIRTLLDAPVPQFGLLVTGTGKPPAIVLVDSIILTWSLGQISVTTNEVATFDHSLIGVFYYQY